MIVKQIIDEDFSNYKIPSLFLALPRCNMKCGAENCHNRHLLDAPDIEIGVKALVQRYLDNPITSAVVLAGLEPFDAFEDWMDFVRMLRRYSDDDVVIYTGYDEHELKFEIGWLGKYKNIVVKFGRYIPNQESHFDDVLGINLSSDNQYGKVIS